MREPCYVLDNQYLLLHNEYRPANVVWEGTTFVDIERLGKHGAGSSVLALSLVLRIRQCIYYVLDN